MFKFNFRHFNISTFQYFYCLHIQGIIPWLYSLIIEKKMKIAIIGVGNTGSACEFMADEARSVFVKQHVIELS
jgi:hypothetical protein